MRWIALLAAIVAATAAIGETGALAAGARHSAETTSARLEGGYILKGRVTVATAVRGEHVGNTSRDGGHSRPHAPSARVRGSA